MNATPIDLTPFENPVQYAINQTRLGYEQGLKYAFADIQFYLVLFIVFSTTMIILAAIPKRRIPKGSKLEKYLDVTFFTCLLSIWVISIVMLLSIYSLTTMG